MKKFKLPRKKKKFLKKGFWLYPADEKGNSVWARPHKNEKDYLAFEKGLLRNLNQTSKKEMLEYGAELDKVVNVSDEILRVYVNDIFAKEYRQSSYDILREAKKKKGSIIAYYNFINAYEIYKDGDDSSANTCCMSVDLARELLKKYKKK